jgi:hypothetical protein
MHRSARPKNRGRVSKHKLPYLTGSRSASPPAMKTTPLPATTKSPPPDSPTVLGSFKACSTMRPQRRA